MYYEHASALDSFWDFNTSGLNGSASGIGLASTQMQEIQTFLAAGWDFVDESQNGGHDIWQMPGGGGYPILSQESRLKLSGHGLPDDPYLISTRIELAAVSRDPAAAFKLMADIDLAGTRWLTSIVPKFAGRFNGNGFVISNMTIDGSEDISHDLNLGLFGKLEEGAEVYDLGVVDVNITNNEDSVSTTGGIVGLNEEGRVFNCFSTGKLYGRQYVGGIVGDNDGGSVSNCHSATTVSGLALIGGIAGHNGGGGDVSNCSSTGTLQGNVIGGIVGVNRAVVTCCYSTSMVRGYNVGGIVASNEGSGSVTYCYSTGMVEGHNVGGIVGDNEAGVAYCYSTGVVSGDNPPGAGGLVGKVTNDSYIDEVTSSFWDIEISGQVESKGGVGLTTDQMQDITTYLEDGWGIAYHPLNSPDDPWWMPKHGTPRLWWQYGYAYWPSPVHTASNVSRDTILQWNSGGPDLRHELYFGFDEALVASATRESLDVYLGPLAAGVDAFDPGVLQWGKTYYWRIDGINEIDPEGPWQGEVWSFTTADSVPVFTVDDFESYDDHCNRLFFTWQDGWGHSGGEKIEACNMAPYEGNGSNALVGNADPPFAEQVIVYEGGQSLPMDYDNEMWPWFSEAQRIWSTVQDWTKHDADALALYFRGEAENTQYPLYIAVEDSRAGIAVLPHSDAQAVRATEWRQWRIPLNDLDTAGVDVTTIRKLIIGVGDRDNPRSGGTGRIYIDDIQLIKGVL